MPTTPYRSAGRPEAIYVIERLIDLAAAQCGFDRIELRRRNLIPPDAMPYTNGVGITYDNGEYEQGMERRWRSPTGRALPRARPSRARAACCAASASPITSKHQRLSARARRSHRRTRGPRRARHRHHGQRPGPRDQLRAALTEWLGVPFDSVDFVAHDTDRVAAGGGSHSARSMRIASLAIGTASDEIIEKGKRSPRICWRSAPSISTSRDGVFSVKGTDRRVGIFEVAKAAATRDDLPEELRGKLDGDRRRDRSGRRLSSGTHVCEVEIDPETGQVDARALGRASTMSAAPSIR